MRCEVKQDANGVWFAQPYLGTDYDGRQIRPRKSFPDAETRDEAQTKADEWASRLTLGGEIKSTLIVDLLNEYIDDQKAKGAAINTVKRWRMFTRAYVDRYLGGKIASDLTAHELNNFEKRLRLPKGKGGQGLSQNTVIGVHHFLQGAYSYWVRIGVCESNPMLMVEKPREELHEAVSIDEWDFQMLDAAVSDRLYPMERNRKTMREAAYSFAAWFALHTGMRVGEVCAVRRRDLHRAQGYVLVCGNVVELPGGGLERSSETKSKKPRQVSLTEREWSRVLGYMEQQDSFSDAFAPDSALVSVDGSFMRPSTVSRAFSRTCRRCGLPKACTFHSLRHTHATWCLANGVDIKTLAARLGHANEATTLRLYAHLMPGRDAAAAKAFDEFAESLKAGV